MTVQNLLKSKMVHDRCLSKLSLSSLPQQLTLSMHENRWDSQRLPAANHNQPVSVDRSTRSRHSRTSVHPASNRSVGHAMSARLGMWAVGMLLTLSALGHAYQRLFNLKDHSAGAVLPFCRVSGQDVRCEPLHTPFFFHKYPVFPSAMGPV